MKQKMLNNLAIKIISLCLAALFWVVIINIDDPVTTRKVSNVTVTIQNQESITSMGKVYNVVGGDLVDVKVKGKTSEVEKITKNDIIATADLSTLTAPWTAVQINVECTKYPDVEVSLAKNTCVQVSLEDIVTQQFAVNVETKGNVADGYALGVITAKPNMISLSGAKSLIGKIKEVKVQLDVSGAADNITERVIPYAYDNDGNRMDSSKLSFRTRKVKVMAEVLETKDVPLEIQTVGKPAKGYDLITIDYDPKHVEVMGASDALAGISKITIPIDIDGRSNDLEQSVKWTEVTLPKGVYLVNNLESDDIVVKATIQKRETKEITISLDDILLEHLADGLDYQWKTPSNTIVLRLSGTKETLDEITGLTLSPKVSLANLDVGVHQVSLILNLPDGVILENKNSWKIELTEKTVEDPSSENSSGGETVQQPEENNSTDDTDESE
ncbi:MAG: CdaR family protein [Clostridiales bacterium]|nr:CdaR family protein [Clostridiales bacterium]